MRKEIETKILNINKKVLKNNLIKNKAVCLRKRHLVKRWVYQLPNRKDNAWIRIINDGKISLGFKKYKSYRIGGIQELDFDITGELDGLKELLNILGCKLIAEQHCYEENYLLPNKTKIDVEEWPRIPTYIEIEGGSDKLVMETIKKLGFKKEDSQPITTKMVYEKYNFDLHKFKLLDFNYEDSYIRKKI